MIVKYVIAWIQMVVIGIINGVIREQWYGNYLNELRAHQIDYKVRSKMKRLPVSFRLCIILGLALLLSGCFISAQGDRHGRVVLTDGTPPYSIAHNPSPPPHAKAYGHRAKYRYHYYPNSSIYFDTGRSIYFYLDSAGAWRMTASLPHSLKIHLGDYVSIEMEADRPYVKYHEHKKKYPAGKKKKNRK